MRLRDGVTCLATLALALAAPAAAQGPAPAVDTAVKAMSLAAGGTVSVTRSPLSGLATFVSAPPGRAIPVLDPSAVTPTERAVAFLEAYGQAFGLENASQLLVVATPPRDETGMDHVRFRQVHAGIPVTAGELWVHLRGPGVVAANGKTLPLPRELDLRPGVSAEAAIEGARLGLRKQEMDLDGAEFGTPRLEVFNRGFLDGRLARTHLAWFVEVTGPALREYVWVDVRTGSVILHFNQLTDARNRAVYNAYNTNALPGTLVRAEGGPATGDADADNAYTYLGDTYDYFWTQHGRDSWNGGGAPLIATVHYCPNAASCPYGNAFWNGSQMVFGSGFPAADDVDAHELTHAVTETSANLFYYMQSGALNESFSDIFGESVDLGNGRGTDTPAVRWLMGEDIPAGGAGRNMMNPNQFGDPARMGDSAYFTCYDGRSDGGGVHSNSGVPNHAFALMTDGGSYNGYAIAGIGLTKAGKIHYRTLTRYLLSGSDFLDHYNAVKQSCTDLVGTSGITSGDCTEVGKALDATEMDHTWVCSPPQATAPDLCTFGQAPQTLFFDNFEGGGGYWTGTVSRGSFPFYLGSFFATSGTNMLGGDDPPDVTDARLFMATPVAIPPGDVRLQFNHAFGFDHYFSYFNYDGGVLEYSPDGTSWGDLGTLITQGARYNGVLDNRWQNPLGGRSAFGNESWGYTASQVNLAPLAGQSIRVGFRIGADFSEADYGWFIDDVRIYKCVAAQVQVASPNGGESLPGGSTQLLTWTGATSPDGTLEVYYNDGVTRTLLAKLAGTTRSYLWTVPTATTTTGKIEIESKVRAGTEATDQSDATFSITAPAPLPPKVDFNGDGESDILWHHQGDGSLYTWWLQGTVTTAGSYLTPPAFSDTKWQIRGVADFNKDGKQDILWHHQVTGDLYVWYLNGTVVIDGSYLTPQSFSDTKWQIRGVADFDRDGNQDILWHHQGTGDLYVWRLGGLKGVVVQGGSYLNPSRFADTLWQIRAVVDMTKDGKPDLLWHHQGNGDLYLWAMDGYAVKWGSYLTPSRFADTRWQIRRVADFNGDGQLDLLWHHQTNGQLYVWMLQNLVTTAGSYLTPSAFTDVRWQIMPR